MSLATCKPAIDFGGGRKDPPTAAKESTTVRGPIIAGSYWTSRTVPEAVYEVLRISTPRGSFGSLSEDLATVGNAMRSILQPPSSWAGSTTQAYPVSSVVRFAIFPGSMRPSLYVKEA